MFKRRKQTPIPKPTVKATKKRGCLWYLKWFIYVNLITLCLACHRKLHQAPPAEAPAVKPPKMRRCLRLVWC